MIFTLQRCSRSTVDEWEEIFIEANLKIDTIKKKILEIRTHIGQSDQFMFNRAFDFAIEEFIEAIGFFWFLKVWFKIILPLLQEHFRFDLHYKYEIDTMDHTV